MAPISRRTFAAFLATAASDSRARRLLLFYRFLRRRGGHRYDRRRRFRRRCGRRRSHAHGGYRQGPGGDSDQPPDHRERLLPRRVSGRGREARRREPLRPEQPLPRGAVRRHRGAEHHLGRDLARDDRREAAGPHRHHHRGRLRQVRQDRADGLHRRRHALRRGPVPLHRRPGGQAGRRRGLHRRVQRQGGHGEGRDRQASWATAPCPSWRCGPRRSTPWAATSPAAAPSSTTCGG